MAWSASVLYYVTTFSTTAALSEWLTEGAKIVIDLLPVEELERQKTELAIDPSTGTTVSSYRIFDVSCGGYPSQKVDVEESRKYKNPDSIYYAGVEDSVYWYSGGKIYGFPQLKRWSAWGIAYPTVTHDGSTMTGVPDSLQEAVILYTAIQAKISQMSTTSVTDVTALAVDSLTAPTAPTLTTISYSDASADTINAITVGSLGTAPTYTKPTIALTAAPADLTITASAPSALDAFTLTASAPTAPNALTITETPPTAPSAPSFTEIALDDTLIGTLGTIDLGSSPTYSATLPSQPTFVINRSNAPTALTAPAFTYTDADFATAVVQGTVDLTTQLAAIDTALGDSAGNDIDLATGWINDTQTRIQKFQIETNAQLSQLLENAKNETDVNKQNAIQGFVHDVEEFQAKVSRYNAEVGYFQADVTGQYHEHNLNLQSYAEASKTALLDALNDFNATVEIYKATLERNIKTAELNTQILVQQAQLTEDKVKQEAITKLAKEYQEYQASLGLFQNGISKFEAEVREEVEEYAQNLGRFQGQIALFASQVDSENKVYLGTLGRYTNEVNYYSAVVQKSSVEWKANLEKWQTLRQTELQNYQFDIQNELNEFNKENVLYVSTVEKAIKEADIALAVAIDNAKRSDDIDIINKAKAMEVIVQNNRASLEKYIGQIQSYGSNINFSVNKFSNQIQQQVAKHQMFMEEIKELKEQYDRILSSYVREK